MRNPGLRFMRSLRRRKQQGSMLLELLISMVVLSVGLGGVLVLLITSIFTNGKAGNDTSSTMVAEHVMEQISGQPANSVDPLTVTDCAGTAWTVNTVGAAKA